MPDWVNRDAYAWRLLYCHRVACGLLLAAITGFLSETLWQDMFQ